MKTIKITTLVICLLCASNSFGQVSFGVTPGISFNAAYFGYRINPKVMPFFGIQKMGGKINYSEEYTDFNYSQNKPETVSYEETYQGNLIIPNIGAKFFLAEKNKVHTYALLSVAKPLVMAKATYDGEEDKEVKDAMKNTSIWGGELGFGAEYFFDDNFSIGGEFGMRGLSISSKIESDDTYYDPTLNKEVPSKYIQDTRLNFSPTYSKITLNFYF